MLIDILDCISKAVCQIHLKRSGHVLWIDAYYVCLYGHAKVIFLFLNEYFRLFLAYIHIDYYVSQWSLQSQWGFLC